MKKPGARVLYLGAASGTTVSHVSDIVGPVSDLYKIVVYFYLLGLLVLSKKKKKILGLLDCRQNNSFLEEKVY